MDNIGTTGSGEPEWAVAEIRRADPDKLRHVADILRILATSMSAHGRALNDINNLRERHRERAHSRALKLRLAVHADLARLELAGTTVTAALPLRSPTSDLMQGYLDTVHGQLIRTLDLAQLAIDVTAVPG